MSWPPCHHSLAGAELSSQLLTSRGHKSSPVLTMMKGFALLRSPPGIAVLHTYQPGLEGKGKWVLSHVLAEHGRRVDQQRAILGLL